MSDIVERLRKRGWGSNVTDTLNRWDIERTEAAAEITRLRAELSEARDKALDEAAEVAEDYTRNYSPWTITGLSENLAQTIRTLKSPKPPIL